VDKDEKNKDLGKETSSERQTIEKEIQDLNIQYKGLVQQKQQLGAQLRNVDEELLKKVGAFQALKALLDKLAPKEDKAPENTPPPDDKKDENS